MDDYDDDPKPSVSNLPNATFSELRGKQSVRATFKLSPKAIKTLSIVALQLGIKQKSLFDHLMEDIKTLEAIADTIHLRRFKEINRVQKTFVLSRKTLSSLEYACQNFDTSRDALVEYSIKRLLPVIAQERERHERRKKVLAALEAHVAQGEMLLAEAGSLLGQEDPIFLKVYTAISTCKQALENSRDLVEKGKSIEKF